MKYTKTNIGNDFLQQAAHNRRHAEQKPATRGDTNNQHETEEIGNISTQGQSSNKLERLPFSYRCGELVCKYDDNLLVIVAF
jgi:hypothetical protein